MTDFGESEALTHELLTADVEARAEIVKDNFDITAVYGWHLTPEHARDVVEYIGDNCLVFVEGHMRERKYATMRLAQHMALAETRLVRGTYVTDAAEDCESLAAEFLLRQHSIPTEHDLHTYNLYKGLLDKGCIVLPADYINLDESTPELIPLEGLQNELRAFFPIESDEDLERAIELDTNLHTKYIHNQAIREQAAFNLILYFLSNYLGAQGLQSLAQTPEGKPKVYVIFGLAHRDSLTAHFESYGIPLERIFVNSDNTPLEELKNLAIEFAQSPAEQRAMIRNYYLGLIAAQQETQN